MGDRGSDSAPLPSQPDGSSIPQASMQQQYSPQGSYVVETVNAASKLLSAVSAPLPGLYPSTSSMLQQQAPPIHSSWMRPSQQQPQQQQYAQYQMPSPTAPQSAFATQQMQQQIPPPLQNGSGMSQYPVQQYTQAQVYGQMQQPPQQMQQQQIPSTGYSERDKPIPERRQVHVGKNLAKISRAPSIMVFVFLCTRVIVNIVALVMLANAMGAAKLTSTTWGIVVLAISLVLMLSDLVYAVQLFERDRRSNVVIRTGTNSRHRTRIPDSRFAAWTLIAAILQFAGMFATGIISSATLLKVSGGDERYSGMCAAVISFVHMACDGLVVGSLVLDWLWTNNVILLQKVLYRNNRDDSGSICGDDATAASMVEMDTTLYNGQ